MPSVRRCALKARELPCKRRRSAIDDQLRPPGRSAGRDRPCPPGKLVRNRRHLLVRCQRGTDLVRTDPRRRQVARPIADDYAWFGDIEIAFPLPWGEIIFERRGTSA